MDVDEERRLVDQAVLLRDVGDHAGAAALLQGSLTTPANGTLRIVSELGKSLQHQGYVQRALEALREGFQRLCPSPIDTLRKPLVQLEIEMQICMLEPMVEGNFAASLSRSSTIYEDYLCIMTSAQVDSPSVSLPFVDNNPD